MTPTTCMCHPGTTCTSAASCATARELHFGAQSAAVSDAEIDVHLDAILRASGSALRHYTMAKTKDDMRAALRSAILALRPQAVPMTDEQISAMGRSCIAAWVSIAPGSDLHRIVRAVEAHHGITQRADGGEVER